jgi:hypothetical protein
MGTRVAANEGLSATKRPLSGGPCFKWINQHDRKNSSKYLKAIVFEISREAIAACP